MKTATIDVKKIDKTALVRGEKGTYLDLVFFENKNGQGRYGDDGFIVQSIPKERREAGEKGPIIGNWKHGKDSQPAAPQTTSDDEDIPF